MIIQKKILEELIAKDKKLLKVLDNKKNEQGFTIDEIGSLPVDQATRGGFNCRHDWVPV